MENQVESTKFNRDCLQVGVGLLGSITTFTLVSSGSPFPDLALKVLSGMFLCMNELRMGCTSSPVLGFVKSDIASTNYAMTYVTSERKIKVSCWATECVA